MGQEFPECVYYRKPVHMIKLKGQLMKVPLNGIGNWIKTTDPKIEITSSGHIKLHHSIKHFNVCRLHTFIRHFNVYRLYTYIRHVYVHCLITFIKHVNIVLFVDFHKALILFAHFYKTRAF